MKKTKLYLAHPLDSRKYMREWELKIEKNLNIEIVNPFYDLYRDDIKKLDLGRRERYIKADANQIVLRDLDAIKKCQGILAMITGDLSYGTIQEMVYAKIMSKKVYSVITNGHENHPWLKYHSSLIFTHLDKLEQFLLNDRRINE